MAEMSEVYYFSDALSFSLRNYSSDFKLKSSQREALQYIFETGKDLIVNLPTGYGKSFIYHTLPDLLKFRLCGCASRFGSVLVISPLNIIQNDQLLSLSEKGITSCRLDVTCKANTFQVI